MADPSDQSERQPLEAALVDRGAITPEHLEALFREHGSELKRFVMGVVRDPELANDVLQTTLAKAIELGHTARTETFKGWLFRVAFHEAIAAKRRQSRQERAHWRLANRSVTVSQSPDEPLIRSETIERVRKAVADLSPEQRKVVWARMYEEKAFATIANEFSLPLGTVLTRMRLALDKLRRVLSAGE